MRHTASLIILVATAAGLTIASAAEDRFPELAPDQVVAGKAQAVPGVPGALVCRSLAGVAFATAQMRDGGSPNLALLGCTLLAAGTPVTIEQEGQSWIVRSQTLLGVAVRGVTDPAMIKLEKLPP